MKVWKDKFTGDAMVSTDFKFKEIFNKTGLEVIGSFVTPTTPNKVGGQPLSH